MRHKVKNGMIKINEKSDFYKNNLKGERNKWQA